MQSITEARQVAGAVRCLDHVTAMLALLSDPHRRADIVGSFDDDLTRHVDHEVDTFEPAVDEVYDDTADIRQAVATAAIKHYEELLRVRQQDLTEELRGYGYDAVSSATDNGAAGAQQAVA